MHSFPTIKRESKDDDFVVVEFPYDLSPYTSYQLNKILSGWLKDKKEEVKAEDSFYIPKTKYCAGWILSKQLDSKKIALFNVANYPSSTSQLNKEYPTLDESLLAYAQKKIPCQKLVIPIAELNRKHFRLLVIEPDKNQAIFYDSKSRVVGMVAEMIFANSLEEYRYIENTCKNYFPDIAFYGVYFGDQPWNNHEDCGPYTVEYAFQEILPGNITKVDQARVNHDKLFNKGVMDAKPKKDEKDVMGAKPKPALTIKPYYKWLFWSEGDNSPEEWVNVDVPSPKTHVSKK